MYFTFNGNLRVGAKSAPQIFDETLINNEEKPYLKIGAAASFVLVVLWACSR